MPEAPKSAPFARLTTFFSYAGWRGRWARQVYSQEAFRQFLAIERKRTEHSPRSFVLVLVSLREELGGEPLIPARVASGIFAGLAHSVREVDFIGWYKEGRVAGAVLVQDGKPAANVAPLIMKKITFGLSGHVPDGVRGQLKVRAAHVRRKTVGMA